MSVCGQLRVEAIPSNMLGPPRRGENIVILNLAHDNGALDVSTVNIRLLDTH